MIGRKVSRALWYLHTHARMHARTHARTPSLSLSLSHTHTGAKRVYAGVDDGAGWHKFYGQMITVLSLSPTLEHSFTGRGDFVLFGNCCVPIAVVVVA